MSQDHPKAVILRVAAASVYVAAALLSMASGLPALAFHKQYAPMKANFFCPGDRIVWLNTRSGVYHLEGERWFGRTWDGKFLCEKAARAEGDRETRNGQ